MFFVWVWSDGTIDYNDIPVEHDHLRQQISDFAQLKKGSYSAVIAVSYEHGAMSLYGYERGTVIEER